MDIERVKNYLVGISLADHMGDVNDYLPDVCEALDLPKPEWSDSKERFVFSWETTEDDD